MNVRLRLAALGLPFPVRTKLFGEFFALTARSFGAALPDLRRLSHRRRLALYRDFTLELAAAAPPGTPAWDAAAARLGENGRDFGRRIRRLLRAETEAEAMAAARILYRAVGIDFAGEPGGDIAIRRCYFADRYSRDVCRLVSALDEGVLAGLHEGGRLEFRARITEGAPACLANFTRRETPP
jgi:hypothetical protein